MKQNPVKWNTEKVCRICLVSKPFSDFAKSKKSSDGHWIHCKICSCERAKSWYRANVERSKITTQAWRDANRERVTETMTMWRQANAERLKEYRRTDYQANAARDLKAARQWKRDNAPVVNALNAKRQAAKYGAIPLWADLDKIAELYAEARALTLSAGTPYHVDHIVPLQSKLVCGLHCEANLQILPGSENQSKSNRCWPDMGNIV